MTIKNDIQHFTPTERRVVNHGHDVNMWEGRGFSWGDFGDINYGTFRNVIHGLHQKRAIYTISRGTYAVAGTGIKVDPLFRGHMVGGGRKLLQDLLLSLGNAVACVHDLHLVFDCPPLYDKLDLVPRPVSKDKALTPMEFPAGRRVQVIAHDTGRVSVRVACSENPFPRNNLVGLVLVLDEVRQRLMSVYLRSTEGLPLVAEWVVKVWHYNRDGGSIKGADFEVTVTDLNDTLYRFYSKEFRGPTVRPRLERVETPGKPLVELMGQVLSEAPP